MLLSLILSHFPIKLLCILLNILFTSSGLNKTLMPLVNCFIPPPKHPITKGTAMTLYCSRLSRNSNANCWCFRSFSILFSWMFDSYGHAISTMQIIFFNPSSNVRSGRLAVFIDLIRCSQSQRSLYPFLWITLPFVQFPFHDFVSGGSMPLLIAHRTANTFSALLCRQTYSVLANFSQPARRCCTVSFYFRYSRH